MQKPNRNLAALKLLLPLAVLLVAMTQVMAGGTWSVNTLADSHAANPVSSPNDANGNISLRSAIEAASAQNGTSLIKVQPMTYKLTLGELDPGVFGSANITISNVFGSIPTLVSQSDGQNRVFNIDSNSLGSVTVSLFGLTIADGTDATDNLGGAGILAGSLTASQQDSLTLVNCLIISNRCQTLTTSGNPGGGVQMEGGSLYVTNCIFARNDSASSQGAGIFFYQPNIASTFIVSGCVFETNTIEDTQGWGVGGCGICLSGVNTSGTQSIVGSTFASNTVIGTFASAPVYGAVQADQVSSSILISGCSFESNAVASSVGASYGAALAMNSGTASVHYCRFFANEAEDNSVLFSSVLNSASVNATENWWGCNGGPGASGCGGITGDGSDKSAGSTVTYTPWMTLTISATPSSIPVAGSSTLGISFLQDSSRNGLNPNNLGAFTGVPIILDNPTLGTLSMAQYAIQSSGTAAATFTAGHVSGTAQYGAIVDNATVTGNINIVAGPATHLVVNLPSSTTAGVPFNGTVTAKDQFNNTATGYTGTVTFTSSDGQAIVPVNSTLSSGVGTFSFTLDTAGNQTVTATDTVTTSTTGTSGNVPVSPGAATHFLVSLPSSATAGVAVSGTVTAQDAFNNTATGYSGTVHFNSTDSQAILPANSTLTSGVGTFNFTLQTVGSQSVTATDTVTTSITGTSGTVTVSGGAATHFMVSLPSSANAGSAFNGTVTALDQFNNVANGYGGTVHFTSSDGQAVLPANTTLTSGAGTFSFTLKTSGNQTVTATDTGSSSITGTSGTVAVSAGTATHLVVSLPSSTTAGVAFTGTVTAKDQFNNTATGYTGTVHFTSSDSGVSVILPVNTTLSSGVRTIVNGFALVTAGNQTVTATDVAAPSITGTSGTVTVSAGAATHLVVSLPSSATAGVSISGTVTAADRFNNVATGYTGTVHFTSSDGAATLPANSTLTLGVGTFNFTLATSGSQTVTATDTTTSSITGTSGSVTVSTGGATHFVVTGPASAAAGIGFSVTVTALDQFNNLVTTYGGTVHFTSSDGQAVLPANTTLSSGMGTFSVTLKTSGNQTVTATDTGSSSITGTSGTVAVSAGAATYLVVSAPSSATAGVAFTGTVTAKDQFNNTATGYAGLVHFTSSDPGAGIILPASSTLSAGVGTFVNGFTLDTAGIQTITARDSSILYITGTSGTVTVNPGAATHLVVSLPSSASTGVPISGTVTAADRFNNIATGYTGTVHFTSSDAQAVLPTDSTLASGAGTFNFTLKTSGNQTVTATDTTTPSITGTSGLVNVTASVISPVVQCPGTINTNSADGECGQTVSFAATSTGPATITYTIDGSTVITSPYIFPVGTNVVTSTATNSVGTNICAFSVVVTNSEPPVAGAFAMDPQESTAESIPVAKILLVCESPRGGTLSIASVTSPTAANGTVTLGGGLLTYTPALNYVGSDSISYVLSDGCGPVVGTVAVTVTSTNAPTQNGLTIQMSGGNAILQFHGIPGTSYYIQQSSPTATGPWVDLPGTPVTADALGLINYTAINPPSPSYYRTSTQP